MEVLSSYAAAELNIKNSRFLAEVLPVTGQAEARTLLKEQKAKYADATHVVHAFVVGNNAEVMGMSDDGEPAGTAGRPILDVLKGRKCSNILLTVTRWFGGTLLGTGGLVKAYGDSAKAVLDAAEFHLLAAKKAFTFAVSYDLYEIAKKFLLTLPAENISEEFTTDVVFKGFIPSEADSQLERYITDLSKGQSDISFGSEVWL